MTEEQDKFLTTLPPGRYTTSNMKEMFKLSTRTVYLYAQTLGIEKDRAHVYLFTQRDVERFKKLIALVCCPE